jgi:hypothetical protein
MEDDFGLYGNDSSGLQTSSQDVGKSSHALKIFLVCFSLIVLFFVIFFGIRYFVNHNSSAENQPQKVSSLCYDVGIIFQKINCSYFEDNGGYNTNLSFSFEEGGSKLGGLSYVIIFQNDKFKSDQIGQFSSRSFNQLNFVFDDVPKSFHLSGNISLSNETLKRDCYSQKVSCVSIEVDNSSEQILNETVPEINETVNQTILVNETFVEDSGSIPPPPPLPS